MDPDYTNEITSLQSWCCTMRYVTRSRPRLHKHFSTIMVLYNALCHEIWTQITQTLLYNHGVVQCAMSRDLDPDYTKPFSTIMVLYNALCHEIWTQITQTLLYNHGVVQCAMSGDLDPDYTNTSLQSWCGTMRYVTRSRPRLHKTLLYNHGVVQCAMSRDLDPDYTNTSLQSWCCTMRYVTRSGPRLHKHFSTIMVLYNALCHRSRPRLHKTLLYSHGVVQCAMSRDLDPDYTKHSLQSWCCTMRYVTRSGPRLHKHFSTIMVWYNAICHEI